MISLVESLQKKLAINRALSLEPGERVYVDGDAYRGFGRVSAETYWGHHIVFTEESGACVAVRIHNGITHIYPATDVKRG